MKKLFVCALFLKIGFSFCQNQSSIDSLFDIGNYEKAILELNKSNKTESLFKIAKAYELLNDFENAILNYELFRTKDTLNAQVNFQYGLALLHENNSNAIEIFKSLVKQNKSEVNYYYLGLAYEKNKDFNKALSCWTASYDLNPYYFKNTYKLTLTLANDKKYNVSDMIASKFLEKYPNNGDILKIRGQVYYHQKNYEECIEDFEKVIKNKKEDENILEKLANAYLVLKEYEKAINIYSDLIDNYELNNPNLFYNRGKCYGFIGKITEAENDINQSIKMREYTFDNEYFYLGYFYQQEEKYDKALQYYQKVLKINSNYSEAVYQMIAIKDHLGQSPKILITEYQDYLERYDNISFQRRYLINSRIKQLTEK